MNRPGEDAARFVFNYRSEFTDRWADPSKFAPKYTYDEPLYPEHQGTQSLEL